MADVTVGTLFIDMKYISLYHKLGFIEVSPDIFMKSYSGLEITIDSENQSFSYLERDYPLTSHRDFVILELLDRLLTLGYGTSDISLNESGITLGELDIRCEQWGDDFEAVLSTMKFEDGQVLYESRLSGGLIDIEYVWFKEGFRFTRGLFESGIEPFRFLPSNPPESLEVLECFVMKGTVLISYTGNDKMVEIPQGIERIDTGAFWNNTSVEEVCIPDSVRVIAGDVFVYCYNLKKVNIPSSVADMGDDPFAGCPDLILSNDSKAFVLEDGVLFTSDRTRLIHYTPSKLDSEYKIPDTVLWVGKHSFYDCNNLRLVIVGKNVDYMGNNPFSDCHNLILRNESPNFIYSDGALLNRNGTTILHYSQGRDSDDYVMPDSVRTVGRNSFWNCKRIRRLVIGRNVRQIGYNPFANCTNVIVESRSPMYSVLDNVLYDSNARETFCCSSAMAKDGIVLQPSTEVIGRNSFAGCESLRSIVIPASVKVVSRGAFSHCTSLKSVIFEGTPRVIEKWAFSYCPNLRRIEIPEGTEFGNEVFIDSPTEVVRL